MDMRTAATIRRKQQRYTIADAAALVGASYDVFYSQLRNGYIRRPNHGHGKRKYYTATDVERIRVLYQHVEEEVQE